MHRQFTGFHFVAHSNSEWKAEYANCANHMQYIWSEIGALQD